MHPHIDSLCLVFLFCLLGFFSTNGQLYNQNPARTVDELLDIDDQQLPDQQRSRRTKGAAMRYMQQLFEQHKLRSVNDLEKNDGTIVRCFTPMLMNGGRTKTKTQSEEMSVSFNLETIKDSEQVLKAELHFNQVLNAKWNKLEAVSAWSGRRMKLLLTTATWLSWDASGLVMDALMNNESTISVEFIRRGRPLAKGQILRRNMPFLLVFTSQKTNKENNKNDEKKRNKRSTYYTYSDNNNEEERRRIEEQRQLETMLNAGPEILRTRKQTKRMRKQSASSKSDPMKGFGVVNKDNNRNQPDDVTVVLLKDGEERGGGRCALHELVLDFKAIGWHHRIIAPKQFAAHFCAGTCSFPLDTSLNPTNHALLQSLITATGAGRVPAVCCAPDRMDSLTLLYFDGHDNVVLKSYDRMIVSSCTCL